MRNGEGRYHLYLLYLLIHIMAIISGDLGKHFLRARLLITLANRQQSDNKSD